MFYHKTGILDKEIGNYLVIRKQNTQRLEDYSMKITSNAILGTMGNVGKPRGMGVPKQECQTEGTDKFYDQISLSSESNENNTLKDVSVKLSHEVRTHNTTGKIAELREAVQSGTYCVDARETAARMLLMGAVE